MSGHIWLYGEKDEVLNWRFFENKDQCIKIMKTWQSAYLESAVYFQIYIRPTIIKRHRSEENNEEEKKPIERSPAIYNNLPIYNYDK